jgi:Zn-dependent peptidase ImmA (M78 family)
MRDYHIYNAADICEREANLFASQLLIADGDFLDCASMQYTSAQIAAELNVHEELAIIKGTILNRQGYKFNIPFLPSATYLERRG